MSDRELDAVTPTWERACAESRRTRIRAAMPFTCPVHDAGRACPFADALQSWLRTVDHTADRAPLHRLPLTFLPSAESSRGDADPARPAPRHFVSPQVFNQCHDAWHHHDLLVVAVRVRIRELFGPAHDRARDMGVPAAERLQFLDDGVRAVFSSTSASGRRVRDLYEWGPLRTWAGSRTPH